ncbi:MAG: VCBS repeat-containing protein, partial [Wenzhouxiangella sp.]|nr:VCBS repeat-containing protein [Wenzhouxiangella sp.]
SHTITITVLGTSRPESSGTRVQVDFFDVWDGQPLAEGTFEEDSDRFWLSGGWGVTEEPEASGGAFASANSDVSAWIAFTGDSLTYQARTRSDAQDVELRVNGIPIGRFDLYGYFSSPRNYSFDNLGPGPHVLEIRQYRRAATLDAVNVPAIEPAFEAPAAPAIQRFEEDHPDMRYNGQPYASMPQSWFLDTLFWTSSGGFNVNTSAVGNTWSLSFEGQWLNVGLRASVGEVEIVIDNVSQGVFDTSGGVNGVRNFVFDLDPGIHEVDVILVSGTLAPDYMDVWQGGPVPPGWYDARLENEESGLFHLSRKSSWLRSEDIYALEGRYLRPFVNFSTNIWFTFVGNDLTVLGNQFDGTSLQVVIDGVDQGVFDMSTPAPFRGQPFSLHFPDLGEGAHVVQVFPSLNGGRIDAFEVNPEEFSSFLPEVEWYDTSAQEVLPGQAGSGFVTTVAIGDLNHDGVVELVAPSNNGRLYVYRGDGMDAGNGTPIQWSTDLVGPAAEPALADLTGDGNAEIILTGREGTFAFRHDGQLLWSNPDVVSFNTSEEFGWGGASVGNLDLSPEPEIVISAAEDALYVLDHEGNIEWSTPIANRFPPPPVLADLTGDGILDILMADEWDLRLFDYFNGGQLVWQYTQPDQVISLGGNGAFGSPGVADLTGDGQPEIVMNWGVFVEALDANGALVWKYDTGRDNHIRPSPITIADTTGDGELNIVTASARGGLIIQTHTLMVLNRFGDLVWERAVGDNSASASGVAAQDLTGNGAWEVIWNGATDGFLLFDGSDGTPLVNEPYTRSGTVLDYPSLGDVDSDGQAEIVVAGVNGLFVIGHSSNWVDSRPVWNQHNYHINNIGNDWSVPFTEQNSWEVHNTYRTQTPDRDPDCATVNGEIVPPRILQLSPAADSLLPSNVSMVVSGRAIPVNALQPLLDVQVDGRSVATLDPSGTFFADIELAPGSNLITVTAIDRCGQAEAILELTGAGDAADPWANFADASVLLEAGFAGTTFDKTSGQVQVDVQAVNAGGTLAGPILMAVSEKADASL